MINQNQSPTEEIIFSYIGNTKSHWISIFEYIHKKYPEFVEEWRYYKDGKSWLLKIQRKSKTICWVSVLKGKFKMTFYFTDRAESAIFESSISEQLKQQFRDGKYYNKIRGLTITFTSKEDVEFTKILLEIKSSIK